MFFFVNLVKKTGYVEVQFCNVYLLFEV